MRPFHFFTQSTYEAQELLRHSDWSFFELERYNLWLVYAAIIVLAAAILPRILTGRIITAPMIYLIIGIILSQFLLAENKPDPMEELWWIKRVTEMVVIISLTNAGLKLNKPFHINTWKNSRKLLIIGMPLTILITGLLGYWVFGFVAATAALLAAVIAPTDPVLASEVQTSSPEEEDVSPTRLALTSEAGVNDGLAFPFTYLAIAMAALGTQDLSWLWGWFVMDFVYRIVIGIAIGWFAGWLLNKIIIVLPKREHFDRTHTGILVISLTLLPYGMAELASAYGFVAVFVAAAVFRNLESNHKYQKNLHNFSEEIENILVAVIFVLLGIYAANDLLSNLTMGHVIFCVVLIFIVRPLIGYISFLGSSLQPMQRFTMSFFGIRGIGSLFYISFAFYAQEFEQADEAFALVAFLIILSVAVHGLSAPFAVRHLEKKENKLP